MSKRSVTRWSLLPLVALLFGGSAAAQGTRATITGQVTDSTGGNPLAGAEVFIVTAGGTTATRGARTNLSGRYTITEVPAGTVRIRARFIGYAPKDETLTL